MEPYPLRFVPILKEKVWGGRKLARYGKPLPPGVRIGESWEIADLAETSRSGGGGGPARSMIAGGPLAGRTLREALERWGEDLLGDAPATASGDFPLLVKFLDASEPLSVQVHPDEGYVRRHPGAHLKAECWYVVEADPGSAIFKGLRSGATREAIRRAAQEGTLPEWLLRVEARPGEVHELPSGTVHALGGGVVVAEVQTPSDTTFRFYDWATEYGREGRELHLEAALECMKLEAPPPPLRLPDTERRARLVHTPYFDLWVWRVAPGVHAGELPGRGACLIFMQIEGEAELLSRQGLFEPELLGPGDTLLLPAALRQDAFLAGRSQGALLCIEPGTRSMP